MERPRYNQDAPASLLEAASKIQFPRSQELRTCRQALVGGSLREGARGTNTSQAGGLPESAQYSGVIVQAWP